jgi:hypothetical protein
MPSAPNPYKPSSQGDEGGAASLRDGGCYGVTPRLTHTMFEPRNHLLVRKQRRSRIDDRQAGEVGRQLPIRDIARRYENWNHDHILPRRPTLKTDNPTHTVDRTGADASSRSSSTATLANPVSAFTVSATARRRDIYAA